MSQLITYNYIEPTVHPFINKIFQEQPQLITKATVLKKKKKKEKQTNGFL